MSKAHAQLLARKRDLFAALRRLEADYQDGSIDERAYRSARDRYELEAAGIVERLDALAAADDPPPRPRAGGSAWAVAGAAVLAVSAVVLYLAMSLHVRLPGQSVTGSAGSAPAPAVSPRLLAARDAVRAHPRNVEALVQLGNVYLELGNVAAADGSYRRAMQLAPRQAEPTTLHAMVLGGEGQDVAALRLLGRVERAYPTYAKAWLLDGLISRHHRATYPRAIAAWRRFLQLQPHSRLAPAVRTWLAGVEKAQKTRKP